MELTSDNKRIAKNTLFLYIRTIVILLISLYTSRVVLETLGEVDFGIYNLVGGIVVLFAFMNNAMSASIQRYLSFEIGRNNVNEAHRLFSMSISTHLFFSFIVFVLGETIGLWFVQTQLNIPEGRESAAFWVYQFSLVGCCVKILRIPYYACIVAFEHMSFYAYLSMIEAILNLLIVWALIFFLNDKLVLYAFLMVIVIILINIVYYVYCRTSYSISHYTAFWDKQLFYKLMSFSGWSMTGSFANISVNQGLSMLLNIFHGVILNAAIGIATQVQSALSTFIFSFQTALYPQIVKTYAQENIEDFFKFVSQSSRLSYCLVFLVVPAIIVCIDPLLNIWLTVVPEYTKSFVIIFIVYSMVDALSGPLWVSVQATGDIKRYQIIMTFVILSNLPIMIALLLLGVSPVLIVSVRATLNLVTHFIRILYLKKYLCFPAFHYLRDVMVRCTAITILSIPFCLYCMRVLNNDDIVLVIGVFIAITLQSIVLVSLIGIKPNEKKALWKYVQMKFC